MKPTFMALVTAYLIARVFAGPEGAVEASAYALTAAFGLEFLASSWQSRWDTH